MFRALACELNLALEVCIDKNGVAFETNLR